jgi:hypothetical protein
MARRLALLSARLAARQLFGSPAFGAAERAFAVAGSRVASSVLSSSPTQLWQQCSPTRGFASEGESAAGYEEWDQISYPPPRAFVGQMAPDFEAPGTFKSSSAAKRACCPRLTLYFHTNILVDVVCVLPVQCARSVSISGPT